MWAGKGDVGRSENGQNKCGRRTKRAVRQIKARQGKMWARTKTQCKTPKRGKKCVGQVQKNTKQKSERKANVRQCKNNNARKAMWGGSKC
ncbi:hypothetical protein T36_0402 [Helicobacter cinaedi]|uniref:hypothetical protein n=1 Tax=Helicobacter cinaedi TaxID=213 RepID=UPI001F38CE92|nr:hypothetical protein [Helicobacter cinaedi]BDB63774.1 hypothetical protein T36_0218 [Helicobacter cinaedi]BDB63955.1 hypothetical protein T36_0402 [Helicobacter cinaedi]